MWVRAWLSGILFCCNAPLASTPGERSLIVVISMLEGSSTQAMTTAAANFTRVAGGGVIQG